ncbi:MAG: zinc-binding alcohol dehydrogenase family protein [Sphingomonadales bacterium]
MRVAAYREHGSTDNIKLEDWPMPEPGPGEALVRIKAAGFNGFDPMILDATTSLKNPLPMVPCGDGAGVVEALGEGVTDCDVGDRVSILPYGDFGMMGETALGCAREYALVPQSNLLPMPEGLSFEDAAALPVAYGTAYRMMIHRGKVTTGETILILAASGGVGICCLQLAKSVGASVIACASGPEKAQRLRALGADHVIDTSKEDWFEQTRAIAGKARVSGEGGVDVVVNYLGGDSWAKSLKLIKLGGRMLTCGATTGYAPQTDIRYIWSFEQTIIGSDGWTREDQHHLMDLAAKGKLRPVLHCVRPLEETAQTMQEMIDRKVFGKAIITP